MESKIKDYRIKKLLGEGAFGKVYLVESIDGDLYAMKLILINKRDKNDVRQQAKMYTSLHHENIISAREFFFYDQQKYLVIVTEYCPDGNFDDVIGEKDQTKIKKSMTQIANGIFYLHQQKNIIHRDIKPENILLAGQTVKIGDLGLARLIKSSGASTKAGTLWYLAPELMENDKYGFSVDIWSLGVLFLQLLVADRIFNLIEGRQPPATRNDFPPQSLLQKIKSTEMRSLVSEMLIKDHTKRITILEVLKRLNPNGNLKSPKKNKNTKNLQNETINDIYKKTQGFWNFQFNQSLIKKLYEKNADLILEQAENGNKKACFLLGRCYDFGFGFPKNQKKAKQWYLKAYQLGQVHSIHNLYIIQQDKQIKSKYLAEGVRKNQYRSICQIAQRKYLRQQGVDKQKNWKLGLQYLEILAKQNYAPAFYILGLAYNTQGKNYYNQKKAFEYLKKGSQRGHQRCTASVGYSLFNSRNYQQALKKLKEIYDNYPQIVQEQVGQLQSFIGRCYQKLNNYQNAKYFFKKGVSKNYLQSFVGLAEVYEIQKNESQRKAILMRAINLQNDHNNNLQYVSKLLGHIYAAEKKHAQAYPLFKRSAELGNWESHSICGIMLFKGDGVKQNKNKGLQMIKEAKEHGDKKAINFLENNDY